jgi:hypothetical protein
VYIQGQFIPRDEHQFGTGVPVFIGTPAEMPKKTDGGKAIDDTRPVRITLWSQYCGKFGRPPNLLSFAVRGFFENGGEACYVAPTAARRLENYRKALFEIEDLERIDLVSVPEYPVREDNVQPDADDFDRLQRELMAHCRRLGDRFALLDPLPGQSPEEIAKRWNELDGGYAALYYPWLCVPGVKTRLVEVAPSPYVAGVYARVDRRAGPGKAPANEVVEGVTDLGAGAALDQDAQERLSAIGVNYVQPLRGRGFRLWGARTLSPHPAWRYVNVRRVIITVLRWIRENMRDVPFETNGPRLWARIDREITSYLMSLFRSGTLQGGSPEEAFYVHTANNEEGLVTTDVGVAPAVPFEFIVVRLIHGESGVVLSAPKES